MQKTVLITGAGGFIGLNIVKLFHEYGWRVFALVHNNLPDELTSLSGIEIIKGDVTDKDFIHSLKGHFDIVVHAAGLASDIGSEKSFIKLNYEPIKYLSEIPKDKIIYISSSDVYGIKDFQNADEETEMVEFPKNPYPRYKIKSEVWLRNNCDKYVIIRPAAVWGEGDKTLEKRVVDFLEISPFIVHFGKWRGQNRWPLANVKNVAKTVVAAASTNEFDNQAITIIDSEKTTIDDYYRGIAQKYFPNKSYKNIYLPLWIGKLIGLFSTTLSNMLKLRQPLFDPTFYAVHHVSSNLDFSSDKMYKVIKTLKQQKESGALEIRDI